MGAVVHDARMNRNELQVNRTIDGDTAEGHVTAEGHGTPQGHVERG
jgi:hypothetical protein